MSWSSRFGLVFFNLTRTALILIFAYYFIKDFYFGVPESRWIIFSYIILLIVLLILFLLIISKKQISSFNTLASKWFELMKWLAIIGAISIAAERTHDWILDLILAISYLVICVYIALWLLDKIAALSKIYLDSRKKREKTPEQIEKDIQDMWDYGTTDGESSNLPVIAFLLSLIAIFFLYSFVNHIVVMLTNSSPICPS